MKVEPGLDVAVIPYESVAHESFYRFSIRLWKVDIFARLPEPLAIVFFEVDVASVDPNRFISFSINGVEAADGINEGCLVRRTSRVAELGCTYTNPNL